MGGRPDGKGRPFWVRASALVLALLVSFAWPAPSAGYAVLAHEAIIDSAWDTSIRPLLLKRFPQATPEELKEAHGYAYGGAIIQDMGYYPHGNKFFSDLTHYVRSGDFVVALLRDSKDLDGYAFALGALSHYAADNEGHSIGVNRSVPILYPGTKKKYGDVVTYEENPLDHVKTEFGFDILEVAQGRYASDRVPRLHRLRRGASAAGAGLSGNLRVGSQERSGRREQGAGLLPLRRQPAAAEGHARCLELEKDDIQSDQPGITKRKFLYNI